MDMVPFLGNNGGKKKCVYEVLPKWGCQNLLPPLTANKAARSQNV